MFFVLLNDCYAFLCVTQTAKGSLVLVKGLVGQHCAMCAMLVQCAACVGRTVGGNILPFGDKVLPV